MKEFIKQVLLFQSKDTLNKMLGIFYWLNILQIVITTISLIHDL